MKKKWFGKISETVFVVCVSLLFCFAIVFSYPQDSMAGQNDRQGAGKTSAVVRVFKGIRWKPFNGGFTVDLVANSIIRDYHLSSFKYPSRMVVDLPGKWEIEGRREFSLSHDILREITLGAHEDFLRVVFRLNGNVVLSPIIDELEDGIAFTVKDRLVSGMESPQTPSSAKKKDHPPAVIVDSRDVTGEKIIPHVITRERETPKQKNGRIKEIEYLTIPGQFRMTVVAGFPIEEQRSFFLFENTPVKMVVDIPGKWKYDGKTTFRIKGDIVERIRIGAHDSFFRVVLDLTGKRNLSPVVGASENGLTVLLVK